MENMERRAAAWEKGKCQMQHTWKQQINLHKVANPAQKTRDTAPGCQFVRRSAEREGSDLNWGPSNLDILCERPQKKLKYCEVKSKKAANKKKHNKTAKEKQNKTNGPPEKQRLGLGPGAVPTADLSLIFFCPSKC